MNRLEQLKTMSQDDPDNSFIRFAIAMEYKSNDRLEEAIEEFENLRKKDEDYVGLYYHLGECYADNDNEDSAINIYKKGIAIAEKQNDQHAKSELMNAKVNLEMGL